MGKQQEEYTFSHKEVVEALIKQQKLHEGIWMLSVRFGIGAANVHNSADPATDPVPAAPAAIVPIVGIGLMTRETLNPLAVDAATVNPRPRSKR